MFYGPSGAGKKTRIMCLLREMYGSGVERLRSETMTFTTPSNRKIEVMTVSSNYHLEVNPSDAGMYDRTVVIDLIKQVAQTHQIEISGQREFKVIVISEGDELTKDAQHALRRTMEKYVATCRIITPPGSRRPRQHRVPLRSPCVLVASFVPCNSADFLLLRYLSFATKKTIDAVRSSLFLRRIPNRLANVHDWSHFCAGQFVFDFTALSESEKWKNGRQPKKNM